jgi:hypothetical protein
MQSMLTVRLVGNSEVLTELIVDDVANTLLLVAEGQTFRGSGVDLFDALRSLRVELEAASWLICVNGARRDVHPSGMTRQMGRGAYVHYRDRRSTGSDLVDILAPAEPELLRFVKYTKVG